MISLVAASACLATLVPDALAQTTLPGIVVEAATLSSPSKRQREQDEGPAATGAPSPQAAASGSGVEAEKLGTAVTVVTGDELQRQQVRHAADALRSLPGVAVGRTGGFAGETQIRIRGAEANHTLVLIDGVVANQPNTGEFDFALLPAEQIERIEVVRGPHSGLYGSGAIGGVINIVTKSGKGPPTASVWSEVGSFKTVEGGVSASGGTDKAHALVSYSVRQANGFNLASEGSETDAFQRRSFLFKGGLKPTEAFALDFVLRNSEKRGDRDDERFIGSGLTTQGDSFSHFATSYWLAGVEGKLETFGGALTHKIKLNHTQAVLEDTLQPLDLSFSSYARNDNKRSNFAYSSTLRFDTPAIAGAARHFLTGLVDQESESFTPVTGTNVDHERQRLAFAGEYRGEFADRMFITGNVRHDSNDTFEDFTTWRAGASLKLKEWGLRPHASVGTGVRLPTMVEQFGQFANFTSNPNLKPEESFGWDAGIEATFGNGQASLDVTYFDTDLENQITTVFLPGFITTVDNLPGRSRRSGIEVAGRWRPWPFLTLGAAYTWLDAHDSAKLPEIRRPEHSGRFDIAYAFGDGRGTATLAAIYNGQAHDIAFELPFFTQTRVVLGDYWLLTAAASWKLKPGVELFGRVENLLDEKYQEVFGFNTPGIAAYGGVRITFGGEERAAPALASR
jgi:vitamin B12 transporter